jgi:hypothetical protein
MPGYCSYHCSSDVSIERNKGNHLGIGLNTHLLTLCISSMFLGTGASCIYPLLGAKINGWKFCASEVDEVSYRFACENVKRNELEESIRGIISFSYVCCINVYPWVKHCFLAVFSKYG